MNAVRVAWALIVALMLAACANTAPPEPLAPAEPDTRSDPAAPARAATANAPTSPAQAATRRRGAGWDPRLRGEDPPPAPPTGGPTPPQRVVPACKVDADCLGTLHCKGTTCRCVKHSCIAAKDAIDPVIDPAPIPPPET